MTRNGRLFVWESLGVGEGILPGTSTEAPSFVPRYLEGQSAVVIQHVACGDLFTACLTDRGILMTFGSGANGCLGHGNFNEVSQAKIVEALLGYEVVQVSCGASHILAVTNEHEVFAWGRGDNGRLGLGNQETQCTPQPVPIPNNLSARSVHCGVDCSVILTSDNKLLCCGSNRYNKLGMDEVSEAGAEGEPPTPAQSVEEVLSFSPVVTPPLSSLAVKEVAMGTSHTALVTVDGQCFTFGSNQFGQLGVQATSNDDSCMPRFVDTLNDFTVCAVACGDTFTVAVTREGGVFSWGKASRGRLGRRDGETSSPHLVTFAGEDPFAVISLSCSHGNTLLATKPISRATSPLE